MYHVSRVDWQQAIDDISLGKDTPPYETTAESLGLSVDVFNYRLKQYLEPELYGHIPGTFFNEIEDPVAKRAQEAAKKTIIVFQNRALPKINKDGEFDAALREPEDEKPKKRTYVRGRSEEEKKALRNEWLKKDREKKAKAKLIEKYGKEVYEKYFVRGEFSWTAPPRESNGKRVSGTSDTKL